MPIYSTNMLINYSLCFIRLNFIMFHRPKHRALVKTHKMQVEAHHVN